MNNLPFLKHDYRVKAHVMVVSQCEIEVEEVEKGVPESKLDLDRMA